MNRKTGTRISIWRIANINFCQSEKTKSLDSKQINKTSFMKDIAKVCNARITIVNFPINDSKTELTKNLNNKIKQREPNNPLSKYKTKSPYCDLYISIFSL